MTEEAEVSPGGVTAPRLLPLLREPALPILLAASVAMVTREYVPDILLFVGASLLLAVDASRWGFRTAPAEPATPVVRSRTAVGGAITGAAVLTWLPRQSPLTDAAFAAIGIGTLGAVWLRDRGRDRCGGVPDDEVVGVPPRWWVWPSTGVMLAMVELYSFLHQSAPRVDGPGHPTLSTLLEPGLDLWPVRGVAVCLWLLGGWWLVRRVRTWAP